VGSTRVQLNQDGEIGACWGRLMYIAFQMFTTSWLWNGIGTKGLKVESTFCLNWNVGTRAFLSNPRSLRLGWSGLHCNLVFEGLSMLAKGTKEDLYLTTLQAKNFIVWFGKLNIWLGIKRAFTERNRIHKKAYVRHPFWCWEKKFTDIGIFELPVISCAEFLQMSNTQFRK